MRTTSKSDFVGTTRGTATRAFNLISHMIQDILTLSFIVRSCLVGWLSDLESHTSIGGEVEKRSRGASSPRSATLFSSSFEDSHGNSNPIAIAQIYHTNILNGTPCCNCPLPNARRQHPSHYLLPSCNHTILQESVLEIIPTARLAPCAYHHLFPSDPVFIVKVLSMEPVFVSLGFICTATFAFTAALATGETQCPQSN